MKHLLYHSIFLFKKYIYPMITPSNTPIALCESDSHQMEDFDSLLFFKVGVKNGYVPE
ncbi:hypothetical protein FDG42_16350 [Clostridium botulinum]|nr:hypothetical protein [Clostridium botulinum]NFM01948.1 hypothetical protein [Clostridium botulinum]NFM07523.1 hypothetical protein [Clostridium botulinum]NFM14928.1 hypothetical protein [Clostridium botulinum]NFM29540.1 hypothetical protein [Clostridium botulinum]